MLNVLNTIILFGKEFQWPLENALFWLLIVQVALIMFMVIVFAVLIKRVGKNEVVLDSKPVERTLQSISLNLDMVKRVFDVGEKFSCDGLIITANYNSDPISESITAFALVTQNQLDSMQKDGQIEGCYIVVPDMSSEGKVAVSVNYRGKQAIYVIAVGAVEEAPAIIEDDEYVEPILMRSLTGLSLDLGVVQREFTEGDEFNCDGLVVTAEYNFEPTKEIITDYTLIDKDVFDTLAPEALNGCYVIRPSIAVAGKVAVTVHYNDKSAVYMVVVNEKQEQPEVEPETVADEAAAQQNAAPAYGEPTFVYVPMEKEAGSEEEVELEPVEEEVEEKLPERKLTGIRLDFSVVQREFTEGDEFNCDGLLITADYNEEPTEEIITDYTLIDKDVFDTISTETLNGCYVIRPDMSEAGKIAVAVRFHDRTAMYMIVVNEKEEEPEVAESVAEQEVAPVELANEQDSEQEVAADSEQEVDSAEQQAEDDDEHGPAFVFVPVGNELQSEEEVELEPVEEAAPERKLLGIGLDLSLVQREFTVGNEFNCDGLIINANFNADPMFESITDYFVVDASALEDEDIDENGCYVVRPDMSNIGKQIVTVKYKQLTAYYSVAISEPVEEEKPERALLYITLDTDDVRKDFEQGDAFTCEGLKVTAHFNIEPVEVEIDDYSIVAPDMNAEGTQTVSVQYQDRTVGYRINIVALPEEERRKREPIVIEEESYEGGILRYDRSFTARFIQSSDQVKIWYTKLKNELLSYKKVKARMSWKRETFRYGRETVARFSYRGNTLCMYLPLNAADYEETRFRVEDVSDNATYEDTPCMYRLKNDKRVRLAAELFATVMERYGGVRVEREAEDYYVPYEGLVQLIDKGLIKRVIKNKSDEAIFLQSSTDGKDESSKAAAQAAEQPAQPAEEAVAVEQPAEEPIVELEAVEEIPAEVVEEIPAEVVEEAAAEENPAESAEEVAEEAVEEAAVVEQPEEQPAEPIVELEDVEQPVEQPEEQPEEQTEQPKEQPVDVPVPEAEEISADAVEEAFEVEAEEFSESPADVQEPVQAEAQEEAQDVAQTEAVQAESQTEAQEEAPAEVQETAQEEAPAEVQEAAQEEAPAEAQEAAQEEAPAEAQADVQEEAPAETQEAVQTEAQADDPAAVPAEEAAADVQDDAASDAGANLYAMRRGGRRKKKSRG